MIEHGDTRGFLGRGRNGRTSAEFGARQQILENSFNEKTGVEKEESKRPMGRRGGEERKEEGRKGSEGEKREKEKKMEFAHDRRIPDEYQ